MRLRTGRVDFDMGRHILSVFILSLAALLSACSSGGTTTVSGSLELTISGLPGAAGAAVTVTGPDSFSQDVLQSRTLSDLTPGSYSVTASAVEVGGTTYVPTVDPNSVTVQAGAVATVNVTYAASAAPQGTNLRVDISG